MAIKSGSKWIKFEFRSETGADIFLAGTFNDWNPEQIRMKDKNGDGIYRSSVLLKRGRHEYKFIVNGVWCGDPNCQVWVTNEFGTLNSVTEVG